MQRSCDARTDHAVAGCTREVGVLTEDGVGRSWLIDITCSCAEIMTSRDYVLLLSMDICVHSMAQP